MPHTRSGGFQRALQKSMFLYALIPLLLLVTVTMALTRYMLYCITENDLQRNLSRAADVMERVESYYLQALQELSGDDALAKALQSGQITTDIYARIYAITNNAPIKSVFYLLDSNRSIVGSGITTTPAYLEPEGLETSLIWQRCKRSDNGLAVAGSEGIDPGLLLVTEVKDHEQLCGYVLFELPRTNAFAVLKPDSQMLISDRFRHIVWKTDETLLDSQGRISAEYSSLSGGLQKGNRQLFLIRRQVFHDQLELYAYADTTVYKTIYHALLLGLAGIFLLLTPMLFHVSHRVARKNGQAVDKIAKTMQNTRYETLTQSLEMNTGDEFEKIASSYEQMCRKMRTLIDDNAEIAKQQVISELKQLEAQFNPHFLFNTLEALRVLIKLNPEAANNAIIALSELLRYSVNNAIGTVPLAEDIHYTECYLQIQKYRLQEKLDYSFEISPEAQKCMVPKLVVQPLVENSVKYGNDEQGYCNIKIHAFVAQNKMRIEVYDTGRSLTQEQKRQIQEMINGRDNTTVHNGLYNIHKRLRLAYGSAYGIELKCPPQSAGNCFAAVLPFRKENEDDG